MDYNQNDAKYYRARKRVREIKGFYGNLASYLIINLFFLFINLKTSPDELWFYWPMLGWGIGVLIHGMKVFNYMPFVGKEWEERKIREYMEKDRQDESKFK